MAGRAVMLYIFLAMTCRDNSYQITKVVINVSTHALFFFFIHFLSVGLNLTILFFHCAFSQKGPVNGVCVNAGQISSFLSCSIAAYGSHDC